MQIKTMRIDAELQLERGGRLLAPRIAYHTYGTLDKPVVWVCHALTANSDVFDWWSGLFGPLDLFNPNDYFIVCANVLGSCYGTEGPLSIPEGEKTPYFHQFPEITIRDMVAAHEALRKKLGIEKIHLLIGGSLGGQQALEWSVDKPELFENLALIATNARHSAWGIAFNEAQRMAIRADQSWANSEKKAGEAGMRAARATALLSYRHYDAYGATQTDSDSNPDVYKSVSYQQYQGEKLARRFNAFSYYRLSQAMDSHHLGRNRPSVAHALAGIKARTLCISISSDLLFPPQEQQYLAEHIPGARYTSISSEYGHDGFLVETRKLGALLQEFLHPAETDSSILSEGERPAFPG